MDQRKRKPHKLWHAFRFVPLRKRIIVIGGLLIASLFELCGLTIIVPLFAMLDGNASKGGLKGAIRDSVEAGLNSIGLDFTFTNVLLVVLSLLCLKAAVTILVMRYIGNVMATITTQTRLRLIKGFLDAQWSYFAKKPLGRLVNAVSTGANSIGECFYALASFFGMGFQCLVYVALCAIISPAMAVLAALVAVFMMLSYGRLVRRTKTISKQQARKMRHMAGSFTDAIIGMKAIKAMGRQAQFAKLFAKDSWQLHRLMRSRVVSSEFASEMQEPFIAVILGVGLYFGSAVLHLDLSHQFIIVMVLLRMIGTFNQIQKNFHRLSRLRPRYRKTMEMIDQLEGLREVTTGGEVPDPNLGVEFRKVSFTYPGGKKILANANFRLEPGKLTTLVGPSGVGKSTFLDLIVGLQTPKSGDIILGGIARDQVDLVKWRRMIGYVPQETILFHETVFTNVTLGEPSYSADDVWEVLRAVGAEEFVSAFPNGLNQVVGERGMLLSGGQRQRIALARALLHKPALLILDEATAALDPQMEQTICAEVKQMTARRNLTVISVSHSAQWREIADNVVTIEAFKVAGADHEMEGDEGEAPSSPPIRGVI